MAFRRYPRTSQELWSPLESLVFLPKPSASSCLFIRPSTLGRFQVRRPTRKLLAGRPCFRMVEAHGRYFHAISWSFCRFGTGMQACLIELPPFFSFPLRLWTCSISDTEKLLFPLRRRSTQLRRRWTPSRASWKWCWSWPSGTACDPRMWNDRESKKGLNQVLHDEIR